MKTKVKMPLQLTASKTKMSLLCHFKKKKSLVDTKTELNTGAARQSINDSVNVSE